ncbi:hypothetical protein HTZ77_03120 [Nonomuraea sp. SMC257]|uniref:Thioredoxin domain-containing protein n=1 Tax=Nonomuraea montanisoli TaxID=2741721 RepID=A0A7Y6I2B5_9ACTN|nr:hypothetical protein [Nonomuraea montanisoli]NUW30420.1 hypothetical protein [Nonomuraea montanisoli]
MPFLTALVILFVALGIVNLLLTFGVVRRLREHTRVLERLVRAGGTHAPPEFTDLPRAGDAVGAFTATTVDGEPVSPERLPGRTVAVFLAPECGSCRDKVPAIAAWAGDRDREQVLVVLDGQVTDPADMVRALGPVARVVVEKEGTPVADAFHVRSFPAFCVVERGRMTEVGVDFSRLPAPARA